MSENESHQIILSQKDSDGIFDVTEEILFGFFTKRTFKLKSNMPFTIKSILGSKYAYSDKQMNLENVFTFSEFFPTGDERPFLVLIEDMYGTKSYYWLRFVISVKFIPVDELNSTKEDIGEEKLLEVMKKLFTKFYESAIRITESIIESREYEFYDISYKIRRNGTNVLGYETYMFQPDKTHSVSRIVHEGQNLNIEGEIRFVKYFTFFFSFSDMSTPLLMETLDYGIGNKTPEYNYYRAESPMCTRWVPVECATKLSHPKCSKDLQMLLNSIVNEYREIPLRIELMQKNIFHGQRVTKRFSGIPLSVDLFIQGYCKYYVYGSKVTYSFFVEGLYLDNVKLDIDLTSLEIFGLYVFTNTQYDDRPALICVGLYTESSGSEYRYKWFEPVGIEDRRWLRSVFRAHPDKDIQKIEDKMKAFFEVEEIEEPKTDHLLYFTGFFVGGIIGTILGIIYARRLLLYFRRLYHYAYRRLR